MKKKKTTYKVGDKVKFRTREISFHMSRWAGTTISLNINDYPEQEVIGTIKKVDIVYDSVFNYFIIEEYGFLCHMVSPGDIIGMSTEGVSACDSSDHRSN